MKFCTRIINKIGEYENVEIADLDAKFKNLDRLAQNAMYAIFMKFGTQNKSNIVIY